MSDRVQFPVAVLQNQGDQMEVDQSRYGYIYRTTNLVNGKSYVGKHQIRRSEHWLDYLGSGTAISRAVRKYGQPSFSKELLAYADSLEELNAIEVELINDEVLINPSGVYNLVIAPAAHLVERLDGVDVLSMYFDQLMSMTDIADAVGVSQPAVHAYLQRFRDSDPRFQLIMQGRSLGASKRLGQPVSDAAKAVQRELALTRPKVPCEKCGDHFSEGGTLSTHLKSCDGTPWPHCSECDKRLSKRGSTLCKDHSKYGSKAS